MLFTLKKIFARFFFPLPLVLEIIGLGVLLTFTRRPYRLIGKGLICLGCLLLYLFCCSPFMDQIMYPFEHRYLPVRDSNMSIEYIVVLGGGGIEDKLLPPNSQLDTWTLARVVESVRLKKMFPQAKLIYSGGKLFFKEISNAEMMKKAALSLGVPEQDILIQTKGKNTREEAQVLSLKLKLKKFILVTSASHMPRAMRMFKHYGLQPIPSPCAYLSKRTNNYFWWEFFPSYAGLEKSETLFYEFLGLWWFHLTS